MSSNHTTNLLKSFFLNYIWIGIVLVCLAIILDLQYPSQPSRHIALSILIILIQTIGIAIIVAAVFTFASNTSLFMLKIRNLLQDIVVSRDFLANIDVKSKKEALKALIKPSTGEKEIYNLEDYYNTCVDKTLDITQKSVRSNYSITCVVRYNIDINRVVTRDTGIYRMYPTIEGYKDIEVSLYDYREEFPPVCEKLVVSAPNGKRITFEPLPLEEKIISGEKLLFGKVDLSDIGRDMSHLDVETTWIATEHDHWATIGFQALHPTDGFRYLLKCEDDIKIRSVNVFTFGVDYLVENSGNELIVSSTQWLNEGAGLSVVVSREITS